MRHLHDRRSPDYSARTWDRSNECIRCVEPSEGRAEAVRVLQEAVDHGVNLIDIAESSAPFDYEELIAQALKPYPEICC